MQFTEELVPPATGGAADVGEGMEDGVEALAAMCVGRQIVPSTVSMSQPSMRAEVPQCKFPLASLEREMGSRLESSVTVGGRKTLSIVCSKVRRTQAEVGRWARPMKSST